jgi:hypothetical protein
MHGVADPSSLSNQLGPRKQVAVLDKDKVTKQHVKRPTRQIFQHAMLQTGIVVSPFVIRSKPADVPKTSTSTVFFQQTGTTGAQTKQN